MVEVGVAGFASAAGELAVGVAGDDGADHVRRRSVRLATGAADEAGVVGEQPPPASAVGSEAMRRAMAAVIGPYPSSSPGWSSRPIRVDAATVTWIAGRCPCPRVRCGSARNEARHLDDGVGAALVRGAGVPTSAVDGFVGDGVDRGHQARGAVGGQVAVHPRHAPVGGDQHHPPLADRLLVGVLFLGRAGHAQHRAFHRGPELGRGLFRRPRQHPRLDHRGGLRGQGADGVGQVQGVALGDLPRPQQGQRVGQPFGQVPGATSSGSASTPAAPATPRRPSRG